MILRSPHDLALYITSQRKALKLSQAEVGKLVGLKQQTISEFEKRPDGTKIDTLFRILSALSLDINVLAKDDRSNPSMQWQEEW